MLFPILRAPQAFEQKGAAIPGIRAEMRLASAMACQPSTYLNPKPLLVRTLTYFVLQLGFQLADLLFCERHHLVLTTSTGVGIPQTVACQRIRLADMRMALRPCRTRCSCSKTLWRLEALFLFRRRRRRPAEAKERAAPQKMKTIVDILVRMQTALENAGVVFIPADHTGGAGVRLREAPASKAKRRRSR
jgi:hypothetical protein